MEKKLNEYEVFNNYGLDPISNFELFYVNIFKGWEAKQATLGDIENIMEDTTKVFLKFNISKFSEQDKKLLYKDCKSEIITIKEHLKKQSNFNEKKFLSIKKKYREILGLMYEIEPFVSQDEILEYLELESDYEEMFNEIEHRVVKYSESTTIKSFVEQLESSEKEFEIGMNFRKIPFPMISLEKTRFIVGLKFMNGSVYEYINNSTETGKVRAREIFKDELKELPEGKEKENKAKLYANYIDDTLNYLYEVKNKNDKSHIRNFEKNLFINNTDKINVEEIWNTIAHHCRNNRIPIDEGFKKDFKEKYKYSLV